MKGPLFSVVLAACSLMCPSRAHAARDVHDAYDDEAEDTDPRRNEDEDEGQEDLTEGGLSTGGMTAPKALGETGDTRSEIAKELDESDERDSGRGLEFFWLSGDIGFEALSLDALGNQGLLTEGTPKGASGLAFGAGAGIRILYFNLGARFRYGDLSEFQTWSLLGEASLRVPLGKFEPFGFMGVGYRAVRGSASLDEVGGVDLRLGGGLDYYFSDSFSVGAQASGDILFLKGPTGSVTGAGISGMALLGLHF